MRSQVGLKLMAGCVLALAGMLFAQTSSGALERGFRTPPDSAKPRTWWHWTNGNVTEDGITKDLEWMKRVGIGGFQLADVSAGAGQVVDKKILFGTPEWYHAVRHAAEEAQRLHLEMSIFSSAGWSLAGGPWIGPQQAMKKLVWSETRIKGPENFAAKLDEPPSVTGPVRDIRTNLPTGALNFYRDSAVIAYREPADEQPMQALHPKITTDAGPIDGAALLDDSLNTSVDIAAPKDGGPAWLQYEFNEPFTARALSLGCRSKIPVGRVLASDDGVHFRTIVALPGPEGYHGALVRTFAFGATTAKFFRIEFDGAALSPAAVIHGSETLPAAQYPITEAIFHSDARVDRWEDKGAFGSLMDRYDVVPTPAAPASAEIARNSVINLTAKLAPDGTLHWDVPPGNWTILRMGYSLTGAMNRPSVPAGSGLEVDKLNADYVRDYFHGYMDPIRNSLGSLVGTSVYSMTMDSWEAGMQNWTDAILADFKRLRGYDPSPYLPVLTGRVVESANVSDRFLWDFRRTLADLYAGEFYGTMEDELQKLGMKSYSEASGVALEIPEDTLLNKSRIDIPMGEFWVHALHPESMYYVDVRGAVSAAHVYGRSVVATESFTGGGYEAPYTLKKIADYWFAQGVNRLVFHTSAEQPLDTKPGNTMVGTHINRNITWAELAAPLMTYFARVSFMLQQGVPVADAAYLLPEGAPSTMPFWGAGLAPPLPFGYNYDYLNTDVLLHRTSIGPGGEIHVEGSRAMPGGLNFKLLILPPTREMTPQVLEKIHALVAAGATVLGPRPSASPSLAGYPEADAMVKQLASDLWGDTDGVDDIRHPFGKGMIYTGLMVSEVLNRLQDAPDFTASGPVENMPAWVHRKTPDADIYFVVNQCDRAVKMEARFRSTGRHVEIWRPMTGSTAAVAVESADIPLANLAGNRQAGIEPAEYVARSGFTIVPLQLAERESVFVVFRHDNVEPAPAAPPKTATRLATLNGLWTLRFPAHWGAPASIQLPALTSWTESSIPGVKYFSGTATYEKQWMVPSSWLRPGRQIYIDLGTVRDIAQVRINGASAGMVWAPPYRLDVTRLLKAGENRIAIDVTNEWTNRIVGDRLLPADQRILSPVAAPPGRSFLFGPSGPAESGLIGQVILVSEQSTQSALH